MEREQSTHTPFGSSVATRLYFAAAGQGTLPAQSPKGPIEIILEATDADRETPYWLDDAWWMAAFKLWKDEVVTIRLMPTAGALTNGCVAHQFNMLRRIVPNWRLHAAVYAGECPAGQNSLVGSPFHEIEVIPGPGAPSRTSSAGAAKPSRKPRPTGKEDSTAPTPKLTYCDAIPDWMNGFPGATQGAESLVGAR